MTNSCKWNSVKPHMHVAYFKNEYSNSLLYKVVSCSLTFDLYSCDLFIQRFIYVNSQLILIPALILKMYIVTLPHKVKHLSWHWSWNSCPHKFSACVNASLLKMVKVNLLSHKCTTWYLWASLTFHFDALKLCLHLNNKNQGLTIWQTRALYYIFLAFLSRGSLFRQTYWL